MAIASPVFINVPVPMVLIEGTTVATTFVAPQEVREKHSERGLGMAKVHELPKVVCVFVSLTGRIADARAADREK